MKFTVNNQKHSFNVVDSRLWPLITAFSALILTFGGVLCMHGYVGGSSLLQLGLCMVLLMMFVWWRDVIREVTFESQQTFIVQKGFRKGVSSPYLILCDMFILARVQMFFYLAFYLTVLLQLLSGYNLSFVMLVFWCALILAYVLEVNIGYCDLKLKNAVKDSILFAFIFFASAVWYIQAWKAKVKSLTEQIYVLLSQWQASLEAEIDAIHAKELAYHNIMVKTAITLLLVVGVGLFVYWWFGGGGDGSKDPKDPSDSITPKKDNSSDSNDNLASISTDSISSQGSGGGSSNSTYSSLLEDLDTLLEPPVDTTALKFSGLDKTVFDLIKSSVVGSTLFSNNSSPISEGRERLEALLYSAKELCSLLEKEVLWGSITSTYVDVDVLNILTNKLSGIEVLFKKGTSIPDGVESINKTQLAEMATNLAELLPKDLSNILGGQECPLLCSAVLLYIFTYGTELLSIIKEALECLLERINNYRKNCPTDETEALDKCNEVYGPLRNVFDSWAKKEVGNCTSADNFIKRVFS